MISVACTHGITSTARLIYPTDVIKINKKLKREKVRRPQEISADDRKQPAGLKSHRVAYCGDVSGDAITSSRVYPYLPMALTAPWTIFGIVLKVEY